jgi:hypothetical protein
MVQDDTDIMEVLYIAYPLWGGQTGRQCFVSCTSPTIAPIQEQYFSGSMYCFVTCLPARAHSLETWSRLQDTGKAEPWRLNHRPRPLVTCLDS